MLGVAGAGARELRLQQEAQIKTKTPHTDKVKGELMSELHLARNPKDIEASLFNSLQKINQLLRANSNYIKRK